MAECQKCNLHKSLWYKLATLLDHPNADTGMYSPGELLRAMDHLKRKIRRLTQDNEWLRAEIRELKDTDANSRGIARAWELSYEGLKEEVLCLEARIRELEQK